jgi:hypothetical protein
LAQPRPARDATALCLWVDQRPTGTHRDCDQGAVADALVRAAAEPKLAVTTRVMLIGVLKQFPSLEG